MPNYDGNMYGGRTRTVGVTMSNRRRDKVKKSFVSLFICGHCGKDTEDIKGGIGKVCLSGYANMLCFSCNCEFEDSVKDVAKRYLKVR